MRLRFIGMNGSMGLRFGRVYRLTVSPWQNGVMVTAPIECPYDSEEAFWRNWVHPDAELRTIMADKGRELRQTNNAPSLREKQCPRQEIHGSHNWTSETIMGDTAWCPGKTN